MHILGINSVYHESSACLIEDGRLVAAAEEERFNRVKHGKQVRADNPDELPLEAIRFALQTAGIGLSDIAHVACAADPWEMERVLREGRPSAWSRREDQELFLSTLPNVPRRLAELGFEGEFHWVPHHTAHAASAFHVSPFPESAVLVIDALGDDAFSSRTFHGRDNRMAGLGSVRYPSSLGYLWEIVSVFLGFGVYDAAKVMGLAAYGDPRRHAGAFDRLAWSTPDGGFETAGDLLRFDQIHYYPPSAYLDGLMEVFGTAPRGPGQPLLEEHHDVAAALQGKTNQLVMDMARHLHEATGSSNLCLAGGVALNCVANEHVLSRGPYRELYVQPAAHDGGLALGGAYHVWNEVLGRPRPEPMRHAYWGPSFTDAQIEQDLRRNGLAYRRVEDVEGTVARLLTEGNVVGLFQGAMELGPRALGNRSIVADPRSRAMRDAVNRKVKHREYFRPLAPSVLHEHVRDWFEVEKETTAADFMLMAYVARPDKRTRMGAVLHVDDTCRIQSVRRETNPRFHRLISEFFRLTGVPMVLNTSFNDQEPIICSPSDAIHTFMATQIDYLAIGDFLVAKGPAPTTDDRATVGAALGLDRSAGPAGPASPA